MTAPVLYAHVHTCYTIFSLFLSVCAHVYVTMYMWVPSEGRRG